MMCHVLPLAGACLILAGGGFSATFAAKELQARLQVFSFTASFVDGDFIIDSNEDNGESNRSVWLSFKLHDGVNSTTFSLHRLNRQPLLHFMWSNDADGGLWLTEHAVLNETFNVTSPEKMTFAETQAEANAFARLRNTEEYKVLPFLSDALGNRNVTGMRMNSAHALHRFAADAEQLHGSFAKSQADSLTFVEKRERRRHKRSLRNVVNVMSVFMNKLFSKTNTFACSSPSGRCSNNLRKYTRKRQCKRRGWPITADDYSQGCPGMCGPGCYNCWKHVCHDCCAHQNCLDHDLVCGEESAVSFIKCLTAKGVLWDRNYPSWRLRDSC